MILKDSLKPIEELGSACARTVAMQKACRGERRGAIKQKYRIDPAPKVFSKRYRPTLHIKPRPRAT